MNPIIQFIALSLLCVNTKNYTMHPYEQHTNLVYQAAFSQSALVPTYYNGNIKFTAQSALATTYYNNNRTLLPQSQDVRVQCAQQRTIPSISYSSGLCNRDFRRTQPTIPAYELPRALQASRAPLINTWRPQSPLRPSPTNSDYEPSPVRPTHNPSSTIQNIQINMPSTSTSSTTITMPPSRPRRKPKHFTFEAEHIKQSKKGTLNAIKPKRKGLE